MRKPIRILAIVCQLNSGGLENRLMDIIRNIDNKRVIIDIFTYRLEKGLYDDEVRSLGGTVFYNPPLTIHNMFWYVNYFKKFLLEHPEYKIIHAHQDAWCSVFCKGAYEAEVPVRIAHSRTAIVAYNLKNCIKNIIKLPVKKYANYYFAVSEKAGRWLYGNKLFDEGKVLVWPNAIDAKSFYYNRSIRQQVRLNNNWNDKFIIMHVGNFTPPKNHPFIFKVFNAITSKDKTAVLVLVGGGNHELINKYMKKYNNCDRIQFLGSRSDVNELLQAADVFLFPSIFEGLPGALVEAQASGLPCIISDRIAEEVYITPNITVLSLNDSYELWAKQTLKYKTFIRKNTSQYIENKGYDICTLSSNLCRFYENAYDKALEK